MLSAAALARDDYDIAAVFILLPSALGGGGIKSSWRGNRIETGKNLNPVQKIWGEVGTFGGNFPPKMPRINTGLQKRLHLADHSVFNANVTSELRQHSNVFP
jgi:hypothetical protein